jgi:molecular chaperone GrpE
MEENKEKDKEVITEAEPTTEILDEEPQVEELELEEPRDDELEKLGSELSEVKSQLIRTHAEIENQRKRLSREVDNARKYAIQDFISTLLPAKDSMEKALDISDVENEGALEFLLEGTASTLKICNEAFKLAGVEEIDPKGEAFDPEFHEAMLIKKVENEESNIVLSVFQKGYSVNGRLIRPARVEVSE